MVTKTLQKALPLEFSRLRSEECVSSRFSRELLSIRNNMKNQFMALALVAGIGLLHFPFTAVALPVATTLAATSIGQTNATLNGRVNPNGAVTAVYFQYGLTTNY